MIEAIDRYVDAYKSYLKAVDELENATHEAFPMGCRVIFVVGKRAITGVCHGPSAYPGCIIVADDKTGKLYRPNPYKDGTVGLLCEASKMAFED